MEAESADEIEDGVTDEMPESEEEKGEKIPGNEPRVAANPMNMNMEEKKNIGTKFFILLNVERPGEKAAGQRNVEYRKGKANAIPESLFHVSPRRMNGKIPNMPNE